MVKIEREYKLSVRRQFKPLKFICLYHYFFTMEFSATLISFLLRTDKNRNVLTSNMKTKLYRFCIMSRTLILDHTAYRCVSVWISNVGLLYTNIMTKIITVAITYTAAIRIINARAFTRVMKKYSATKQRVSNTLGTLKTFTSGKDIEMEVLHTHPMLTNNSREITAKLAHESNKQEYHSKFMKNCTKVSVLAKQCIKQSTHYKHRGDREREI